MNSVRLAYLSLAAGLMGYGGLLTWLGLRRPWRPAGTLLRLGMVGAVLLAVAGAVVAAILEARAARPF